MRPVASGVTAYFPEKEFYEVRGQACNTASVLVQWRNQRALRSNFHRRFIAAVYHVSTVGRMVGRKEGRKVAWLTVREAAQSLEISEAAVRKRVQRGTLPHCKGTDGHVYVHM